MLYVSFILREMLNLSLFLLEAQNQLSSLSPPSCLWAQVLFESVKLRYLEGKPKRAVNSVLSLLSDPETVSPDA